MKNFKTIVDAEIMPLTSTQENQLKGGFGDVPTNQGITPNGTNWMCSNHDGCSQTSNIACSNQGGCGTKSPKMFF